MDTREQRVINIRMRFAICRKCEHGKGDGFICDLYKRCCFGRWRAESSSQCPLGKWGGEMDAHKSEVSHV